MRCQLVLSSVVSISQLCLCHLNSKVHQGFTQLDLAPPQPVCGPGPTLEPMEPARERAAYIQTQARAAISRPTASYTRYIRAPASPVRPSAREAAIPSRAHLLLIPWSRGRTAARWSLRESERLTYKRKPERPFRAQPRATRATYAPLPALPDPQRERPRFHHVLTCCSSLGREAERWPDGACARASGLHTNASQSGHFAPNRETHAPHT
jgi:hypothetical protein